MPMQSCAVCHKGFYAAPSHIRRGQGRYRSRSCQAAALRTGEEHPCATCGAPVYRRRGRLRQYPRGVYFCGSACQLHWVHRTYAGEAHPNWRGAQGGYRRALLRAHGQPRCARCGVNDLRVLDAHHRDRDRANDRPENLVWLCCNCHRLVHRHGEPCPLP